MAMRDPTLPTIHERYALHSLLSGDWRAGVALHRTASVTLRKMVLKGWLERRLNAGATEFRITEQLAASLPIDICSRHGVAATSTDIE